MSRCKLISPVLLQLERPMFSPVEEAEFVIYGVKEYERWKKEPFCYGMAAGLLVALLIVLVTRSLGL